MADLKNCPFCGGEAEITTTKTKRGHIAVISCTKCSCRKARLENPYYEGDIFQDAVNSWNTRKPIDNIVERLNREKTAIAETATPRGNGKNYIFGYVNATVRAIEVIMGELKTKGGLTNGKTSACDSL